MLRRRIVPPPFALPAALGLAFGALMASPAASRQDAPKAPSRPPAPTEARVQAAARQFDLIWQYYKQNRVELFEVYWWSRLLLESRSALAPDAREAACDEHLQHMKDLEALVARIRRLGFGRSSDVGASQYYRIEAECWLAEARPK
ncbi:hypothetical protein OJF2_08330 [Aquisphaera giovannonii]|uniref:Uncharacterized protein n=1 Tax=Aquisphaera giovannonii TaxID=406548 RepID=A0A5B9VVJ0_9BACT|nr:hypothetical protein [Aquisphaera giovannonii]QEH32363.1 hypothetical protein OJF2_08330 [Aquisphaera giovannonii]